MPSPLASAGAASTRTPSTPRSNQNRSTSSKASATSGCPQSRSGCSGANRCRYHWPARPSASVIRLHAEPPKALIQLFGGSSPASPRPSRKKYRARSGDPGGAASAARNHGCWSEVWLATTSTITRMPRAWTRRATRRRPRACRTWVDAAVVADVVAAVGERRGVPGSDPQGVDAERLQVGEPGQQAGEVAVAVAVPVGEAARVHLVGDGLAPPWATHPRGHRATR